MSKRDIRRGTTAEEKVKNPSPFLEQYLEDYCEAGGDGYDNGGGEAGSDEMSDDQAPLVVQGGVEQGGHLGPVE